MDRMKTIMNMKKSYLVFSLAISLLSSSLAFAAEYPYIYKGPRPMGMGGAFIAVSNDANALFYNPAGLAYVPEQNATSVSLVIETSRDAVSAYKDALDVSFDDPRETADFLRDYIGENNHAGIVVFPSYAKPNFAFGVFAVGKSDFTAHDYQFPKLELSSLNDVGVAAGFARSFLEEKLSLGATGKLVMRKSLNRIYTLPELTTGDLEDKLRDDSEDGFGVLLDIGTIYRIGEITTGDGTTIQAQAGLSVSNLIGSSMGDAEDITEHVDAGIACKSENLTLAIDYIDILNNFDQDSDIPKRISLGLEYIYDKKYALRTGLHQGYPTYGLGLLGERVRLDLLTYVEEIGTYSGQQKSRRYAFSFAFGF